MPVQKATSHRIASIDALRGFIMFSMIYVNDIAGAGKIVPDWMVHFIDRHDAKMSGMTFVDLVLPAFIFIVGMSIPFSIGQSLDKGESIVGILRHILIRTLSLLLIGVMMVNGTPNTTLMGWSGSLWSVLMYLSAIFAFCAISPANTSERSEKFWRALSACLRIAGFAMLIFLAFAFVGKNGNHIITLSPFSISTKWWGILGLIGWTYLVGSIVFLVFRCNRVALLGCVALLFCVFSASRSTLASGFWLGNYLDFGQSLGSLSAITVAGVLLASILVTPDTSTVFSRIRFTLLFVAATAAGAFLLSGQYIISKNGGTPPWALWSCAITAGLWLILYLSSDVARAEWISKPLAIAGQNVLLAYLLSCMLPSLLAYLGLGSWYWHLSQPELMNAVLRAVGCSIFVLSVTAALNYVGFRLKL